MNDEVAVSTMARLDGKTSVERLLAAIGYPERVSGGSVSFTLRVDGLEMLAEEADGRLVLRCALSAPESMLATLAGYAAGRLMKEEAALSWEEGGAFLWQSAPADADAYALRRLFETFADSCDWWRARLEPHSGDEGPSPFPEVMIRP